MGTPFEDMAEIDRLVHDPSRLAVTSALLSCESADFLFLQRLTGLSKGNLSSHLSKLERGGVVEIEKSRERRPRTVVRLTGAGRKRVAEHWDRLVRLREAAAGWDGAQEPPQE
ncbi:transcriptional regulator [Nocardiopsis valliformis]|uniref:transcriptional regulator n=1 Tax=Nocardiopsis valliformis TaxID=239974 RepID=UPI00034B96F6|nr:transcriptional regulator [Nocardiopsis valliformis]